MQSVATRNVRFAGDSLDEEDHRFRSMLMSCHHVPITQSDVRNARRIAVWVPVVLILSAVALLLVA